MWYVYILECRNRSLYTGVAKDVKSRFRAHLNKTAHYTSYNPPKKIVYTEPFRSKSRAFKREARIKKLTRQKKLALIRSALDR